MAARRVPDRLARDFWVRPDEKMVRLWCRAYATEIDFAVDYQPRVVASFSGILCVDEVYQEDLALLLAVDPAAPDGDRLVGYTLLPKTKEVDQSMVRAFIDRLRIAGVDPGEVITDDSRLYPAVLAEIWPTAMRRLCLFHATRRVVRAVSDVVKHVRRALPTPPPASKPTLLGRLRDTPPADDQHDADAERYRWRLARCTLGIAQAHALHQRISSARAIGRQLGGQPWHRPSMAQADPTRSSDSRRTKRHAWCCRTSNHHRLRGATGRRSVLSEKTCGCTGRCFCIDLRI
jgi:hypothetical protein